LGAIVNSSRGILFPFAPDEPRWEESIETATRAAIAEFRFIAVLRHPGPHN
jgi:orotidine-5'-phosphate decarboxylase